MFKLLFLALALQAEPSVIEVDAQLGSNCDMTGEIRIHFGGRTEVGATEVTEVPINNRGVWDCRLEDTLIEPFDGTIAVDLFVRDTTNIMHPGEMDVVASGSFATAHVRWSPTDGVVPSETGYIIEVKWSEIEPPPPPPPPPPGVIIDDLDTNTEKTGTWINSSGTNPWGADSVYNETPGNYFRWIPDLSDAGDYEVFVWWSTHANRSPTVPYRVTDATGAVTEVIVNQEQNGGQWNSIGIFTFDVGTTGWVEVSTDLATAQNSAVADAVRFELQPVVP